MKIFDPIKNKIFIRSLSKLPVWSINIENTYTARSVIEVLKGL